MDINKLKDQLATAVEQHRAMLKLLADEDREANEAEAADMEALAAKQERLIAQIEQEKRFQKLAIQAAAATDDSTNGDGGASDGDRSADGDPNVSPRTGLPLNNDTVVVGDDRRTLQPFRNFGEQLQAMCRASVPGGTFDPRLKSRMVDIEGRAITGASETISADGGFLVQKETSDELLRKVFETGQILNRVREIPITVGNGLKINAIDETSRVNGSRFGGVQSYWIGEGDEITGTKPKFRQITLDLKKMAALYYATAELLEDADALTVIAGDAFTEELSFRMEDSIVNGNGGPMPLGILNAAALVAVAAEAGQAADTIVFANITKMWSRMFGRSRPNAVWLINQDVEPQLHSLSLTVGTGGAAVYLPANGLSGQPFSTLYGRPVIPVEYCDTLGNQGDIIFADLSAYLLARKGGVRADTSIHVKFTNDEVTFRWIVRVDGQPWWTSALTPFKGTNTQSPIITLAARA